MVKITKKKKNLFLLGDKIQRGLGSSYDNFFFFGFSEDFVFPVKISPPLFSTVREVLHSAKASEKPSSRTHHF